MIQWQNFCLPHDRPWFDYRSFYLFFSQSLPTIITIHTYPQTQRYRHVQDLLCVDKILCYSTKDRTVERPIRVENILYILFAQHHPCTLLDGDNFLPQLRSRSHRRIPSMCTETSRCCLHFLWKRKSSVWASIYPVSIT